MQTMSYGVFQELEAFAVKLGSQLGVGFTVRGYRAVRVRVRVGVSVRVRTRARVRFRGREWGSEG